MVDWNALLERKYNILQQNADSEAAARAAQANLTNTQASLAPGQAAAENAVRQAQARNSNVQSDLAPGLANSEIGLRGAQGLNLGAEADFTKARTVGQMQDNDLFNTPIGGAILQAILGARGLQPQGGGLPSMSSLGMLPAANSVGGRVGTSKILSVTDPAPAAPAAPASSVLEQKPKTAGMLDPNPTAIGSFRFGFQ